MRPQAHLKAWESDAVQAAFKDELCARMGAPANDCDLKLYVTGIGVPAPRKLPEYTGSLRSMKLRAIERTQDRMCARRLAFRSAPQWAAAGTTRMERTAVVRVRSCTASCAVCCCRVRTQVCACLESNLMDMRSTMPPQVPCCAATRSTATATRCVRALTDKFAARPEPAIKAQC